jgi:hypothetical protein
MFTPGLWTPKTRVLHGRAAATAGAQRARAREDGRRCGEGGRGAGYDGGAATEVGRAAARREMIAEREREKLRAEAD